MVRLFNCGYCRKSFVSMAAAQAFAASHQGARLVRVDNPSAQDISEKRFWTIMAVAFTICTILLIIAAEIRTGGW